MLVTMTSDKIVAVDEDETIKLTTRNNVGVTCVYVTCTNGKLSLVGGESIVDSIKLSN